MSRAFALLLVVGSICVAFRPVAALTCPPCNPSSQICNGTANPVHCSSMAPLICEAGNSTGGCATDWSKSKTCSKCCDTRACFANQTCPACTVAQCTASPTCPSRYPDVCLDGEARNGCGAKGMFPSWFCSSCCDRSNCPAPTPAPPTPAPPTPPPTPNPNTTKCPGCSPSSWVCNATKNKDQCPTSFPMLCLGGIRKGECGTQDQLKHWAHCTGCCDTAACFKPCGPCTEAECEGPGAMCGSGLTELCLTTGGCGKSGDFPNWNCPSCCDLSSCSNRSKTTSP